MEGLIHQRKVENIRNFLGIDPGLKGGIALLDSKGVILETRPMPLREKRIDHRAICDFLQPLANCTVFVERAVAFGMGLTGAFNYGMGFAALLIAIDFAGHKTNLVMPAVWTKALHAGLPQGIVEPKSRSLLKAIELWGDRKLPRLRSGRHHDGIVDALLIAEYARRQSQVQ